MNADEDDDTPLAVRKRSSLVSSNSKKRKSLHADLPPGKLVMGIPKATRTGSEE